VGGLNKREFILEAFDQQVIRVAPDPKPGPFGAWQQKDDEKQQSGTSELEPF
jgi:hypothetical protein